MKITKTQLKNLIKEEAQKIKRENELANRKVAILNEIRDMYSDMNEDEINELFGLEKTKAGQVLGMKTSEQKREEAKNKIMAHRVWRAAPAKWAVKFGISEDEAMNQLVDIVMDLGKLPSQVKWNPEKKRIVDAAKYSMHMGPGSPSGGALPEGENK
jgi:hypothetical protein